MKLGLAPIVALLSGCSLFGPPLPPATPREDTAAFSAEPDQARAAFTNCARDYGAAHAKSGVDVDAIADAAVYACTALRDAYAAIANERADYTGKVMGFIDRSDARASKAVAAAVKDAKLAATDAVIRARSD